MSDDKEIRNEEARSFPLGLKLVLALCFIGLLMLLFLFGYFGPQAGESFRERSDGLISHSRGEEPNRRVRIYRK